MRRSTSLRIVVLGAQDVAGRDIYDTLTAWGEDDVLAVLRCKPSRREKFKEWITADLTQPREIRDFVSGHDVVIHAAGPFHGLHQGIVDVCLETGVHYIDLCDDALFLRNILGRDTAAKRAGVTLISGLSCFPGISSVLSDLLVSGWSRVDSMRLLFSPGLKSIEGTLAFQGAFKTAGSVVPRFEAGQRKERLSWSEPEEVKFLPPVRARILRSALAPDLELFPERFGARTVVFKLGFDNRFVGRFLEFASALKHRIRPVPRFLIQAVGSTLGRLTGGGGFCSGLRVEVEGELEKEGVRAAATVVTMGPRSVLGWAAVLYAVEALRAGKWLPPGAYAAVQWAEPEPFLEFLQELPDTRVSIER